MFQTGKAQHLSAFALLVAVTLVLAGKGRYAAGEFGFTFFVLLVAVAFVAATAACISKRCTKSK